MQADQETVADEGEAGEAESDGECPQFLPLRAGSHGAEDYFNQLRNCPR